VQEIASALSARGHASRAKHHISSRLQCTSLNLSGAAIIPYFISYSMQSTVQARRKINMHINAADDRSPGRRAAKGAASCLGGGATPAAQLQGTARARQRTGFRTRWSPTANAHAP